MQKHVKTALTLIFATVFLVIGFIGLIIPVIPGILFLLIAGVLIAGVFPSLRAKLTRNPKMHTLMGRMDASSGMDTLSRIKLMFWASLAAIFPKPKAMHDK